MSAIDIFTIDIDNEYKIKEELLREISKFIYNTGKIDSEFDFFEEIINREKVGSTNLGNKIAIPHVAYSTNDLKPLILICSINNEIKWDESCRPYIKKVILFAGNEFVNEKEGFKIIASLCRKLGDDSVCEKIVTSEKSKNVLDVICDILKI